MKFEYPIPHQWQYQNSPQAVQAANKEGTAAIILTLSQKKDFSTAATEILESYKVKNINNPFQTKINGINAYTFEAEEITQNDPSQPQMTEQEKTQAAAEKLKILFTLYQYNGAIYVLQGMCAKKDFTAQKNNFMYAMNGFKALTDPKRINVVPERIKVVTIANDMTLKDVMIANKIASDRHEEVAILNGMQQNTIVKKGMLVKMIEKRL